MLKSLSGSYFNDIGDFCPEHTAACTGTAGVTAGSPAAWPTLAQYQIFGQNIFYPLIISPPPSFAAAALFAVRLFFLVGFSQSFVSNFSLGRQFLWHWMKIFLPTMTANWIHCAGMFPKFYLTFECRATMRQYLSLILSVYLSESGWSSILQFLQAFCQSDTNLKTIWTLSCVTRCHESCVTCDGGCPGPVTLMFPDNLQRCFVNNASYEEKMHSMR